MNLLAKIQQKAETAKFFDLNYVYASSIRIA